MDSNYYVTTPAEMIVNKCAQLYAQYGYRRFMMNKFEDYALYAENKSFLVDDRLLTFTDGSNLKALKPDITLSIVKNLAKDDHLPLKVFYDEAVYRVKKGEKEFSELRQMGLELIGDDSTYATCEVICLAKASLDAINEHNILDISHMMILLPLIDRACACGIDRADLVSLITQKNADGIRSLFAKYSCNNPLADLVASYAPLHQMIPVLQQLFPESSAVHELAEIAEVLAVQGLSDNVYLDFSLLHNIGYYNGVVFKGYIKDVPVAVLSGGRYDPLLERFGRQDAALGFAIYLDYIRYHRTAQETDVLLIYDQTDTAVSVARAMSVLTDQGYSVLAAASAPADRSFSKTVKVKEVLS